MNLQEEPALYDSYMKTPNLKGKVRLLAFFPELSKWPAFFNSTLIVFCVFCDLM